MAVREIRVAIVGDSASLSRAFGQAQISATTFGEKMALAGEKMRAVGEKMTRNVTLPIVAVGVASAKMALDFHDSMEKMVSLVGVSEKQVNQWSQQLLQLGPKVGKSPRELADALFFVTSAGFRGSAAIDVLTASAKASAAGLGKTKTIADAVTSAVNAYGIKSLSASKATDVLIASVKAGKMPAEALSRVIGQIVPIAQATGVSFDQVGAAIAAMTRQGLSAAQASTGLRGLLSGLLKPANSAVKEFANLGLSMDQVRQSIRDKGLLPTLMDLRARVGDNTTEMAHMFPNIRALNAFLVLTGKNAKDNAGIFKDLANSTGSTDKAFETVSHTAGFKLQQALAQLQSTAIQIGTAIMPALVAIAQKVAAAAQWFANLPAPVRAAALAFGAALAALGPLLTVIGNVVRVIGPLGTAFGAVGGAVGRFASAIPGIASTLGGMTRSMADAKAGASLLGSSLVSSVGKAGLIGAGVAVLTAGVIALASGLFRSAGPAQALQHDLDTMAASARTAKTAMDALTSSADSLRQGHLQVAQAEINLERATQGVTAALQASGRGSLDYRQAILAQKQAEMDLTGAKRILGAETQKAAGAGAAAARALTDQGAATVDATKQTKLLLAISQAVFPTTEQARKATGLYSAELVHLATESGHSGKALQDFQAGALAAAKAITGVTPAADRARQMLNLLGTTNAQGLRTWVSDVKAGLDKGLTITQAQTAATRKALQGVDTTVSMSSFVGSIAAGGQQAVATAAHYVAGVQQLFKSANPDVRHSPSANDLMRTGLQNTANIISTEGARVAATAYNVGSGIIANITMGAKSVAYALSTTVAGIVASAMQSAASAVSSGAARLNSALHSLPGAPALTPLQQQQAAYQQAADQGAMVDQLNQLNIAYQQAATNYTTVAGIYTTAETDYPGTGDYAAVLNALGGFQAAAKAIQDFQDQTKLGLINQAVSAGQTQPIYFAAGGMVNRPTLGMLGESGPEMVLPLSNPRRTRELMGKASAAIGGGGVTIHMTNHFAATDVDAGAIAAKLSYQLRTAAI